MENIYDILSLQLWQTSNTLKTTHVSYILHVLTGDTKRVTFKITDEHN